MNPCPFANTESSSDFDIFAKTPVMESEGGKEMKICVNAAMKSDEIIKLLTDYKEDNVEFKFIKKTGLKLEFEASNIEKQAAVTLAKTLIKGTEFGKILYFTVEAV